MHFNLHLDLQITHTQITVKPPTSYDNVHYFYNTFKYIPNFQPVQQSVTESLSTTKFA
jgi:hypothetical protein